MTSMEKVLRVSDWGAQYNYVTPRLEEKVRLFQWCLFSSDSWWMNIKIL